jgi:hypothetical protein
MSLAFMYRIKENIKRQTQIYRFLKHNFHSGDRKKGEFHKISEKKRQVKRNYLAYKKKPHIS